MTVSISSAQFSKSRPAGQKYYYLLFSPERDELRNFIAQHFPNQGHKVKNTFDGKRLYYIVELTPDESMRAVTAGAMKQPNMFVAGSMRAGVYQTIH